MKTLKELAELVGGELNGPPDLKITGVGGLEHVRQGQITFVSKANLIPQAEICPASAVVMSRALPLLNKPMIRVDNTRLAFAKIMTLFVPAPSFTPGIDKTAVIGPEAKIGRKVYIGPLVSIGSHVKIADGVAIYPGAVIEDHVEIGEGTILHANVVVRYNCKIGAGVIIHAGTVIGSDGFGFVTMEDKKHFKVPQIGNVVIEDDVELGANVAVDRATTGTTLIKRGTKMDNLVQIAHNVEIGEDCQVVAMTGVAGSTKIGDRVTLAGQSGIVGHLTIGNDSIVAARGMVIGNLPPRSFVSGQPARPHTEEMRIAALQSKLPDLFKTIRNLEKRIADLEGKIIGK
ncbi:MAG: UDP-3-O-(3-hydroxymyristoyl)glucosamine N-acyltransferase [Bacillota bacterium]